MRYESSVLSPVRTKASTGMPGTRCDVSQPVRLIRRPSAMRATLVALAGACLLDEVRRDAHERAVDLGRGPLAEGREAQKSRPARRELVDVLRPHPYLDGEALARRHDAHDDVARRDDPAVRVDRELVHDPGQGRAQLGRA